MNYIIESTKAEVFLPKMREKTDGIRSCGDANMVDERDLPDLEVPATEIIDMNE